jgi:hypothetical protein
LFLHRRLHRGTGFAQLAENTLAVLDEDRADRRRDHPGRSPIE